MVAMVHQNLAWSVIQSLKKRQRYPKKTFGAFSIIPFFVQFINQPILGLAVASPSPSCRSRAAKTTVDARVASSRGHEARAGGCQDDEEVLRHVRQQIQSRIR